VLGNPRLRLRLLCSILTVLSPNARPTPPNRRALALKQITNRDIPRVVLKEAGAGCLMGAWMAGWMDGWVGERWLLVLVESIRMPHRKKSSGLHNLSLQ